jgi:hypothetical protein
MASTLSEMIAQYLYNEGDPRSAVPYYRLNSRMRLELEGRLTDVQFRDALAFLCEKEYLRERATKYSLTASGEAYARSLVQLQVSPFTTLVGVVLVILLVAGVLSLGALQADYASLPSEQIQPTLTLSLEGVRAPRFQVGDAVEVVYYGAVNVRQRPGDEKTSTCDWTRPGDRFVLVGGPEYVDGVWWWQVESEACVTGGWIAEERQNGLKLFDYPSLQAAE